MSSQKIASMVKRRLPCIVRSNICPAYHWIQLFKSRQSVLFISILLHILKRSVTPWKHYMDFSLVETERLYNIGLYCHVQLKIMSILLHILKHSVTLWICYRTSAWVNQKGYIHCNMCLIMSHTTENYTVCQLQHKTSVTWSLGYSVTHL